MADERNQKWPHQITSVYRKGDPLPTQAQIAALPAGGERRDQEEAVA